MNTINSIVDLPDEAAGLTDSNEGYLVIHIESLTRLRDIGASETLGQAKHNAFVQMARTRGKENIRIIRAEDKSAYDAVANDNYRASWSGNIRSGERDTSRDWSDASIFPWLHRAEGYTPVTPWSTV